MAVEFRRQGRGAWVAPSAEHLTSAQVMISWFMDSSPEVGFALTTWGLPQILCLPLSLPLPCSLSISLSLSFSKINKHEKIRREGKGAEAERGSVPPMVTQHSSDRIEPRQSLETRWAGPDPES